MTSPEPTPSERAAPIALWRAAGAFIQLLFNLFGAPEEIAAKGVLSRQAKTLMLPWLRAGEAVLRRLLLIEAEALTLTPSSAHSATKTVCAKQAVSFDADAPDTWRVSFRCFTDRQRPHRQTLREAAPARATASSRFPSAWPLAERAEALLRAYNDPAPYARRVARRLQRQPQRADDLLAHSAGAPDLIGREAFAALNAPAYAARRRFASG